ncbi:MAG: valine--tRNA ligase [Alphaproteobacteria bacterium]
MTLDKNFTPSDIESGLYQTWEDSGAFKPSGSGEPYTIMMPPPNVTGSLHIGHALNHTLQDILVRYHRMKGRKTLWQPGTDHASIAVHMVLEKQLNEEGTSRDKLGREAFMERAWEWKEECGNTITSQLRRLGTTPDWSREAFTMDEGLSKAVLTAFVKLYNDGLIYRAERLVNWDPERQTVISDLEVIQKEQKGKMWHIRYPVEGSEETYITVATTRPETMLGDTAVAVHPDDERYKDLVGKSVILPITNRLIPIIADEYSDPEKGSGAVKITPAHDFNDFEVGQRHNLPIMGIMDAHAKIIADEEIPSAYHGLDRYDARKAILAELEELDLLVEVETIKNTIPVGERSGVVIEPFLTKQWFCDTPTLAKEASAAVRDGRTNFVPKQYENMYFAWVDHQLPWCISRQLWWGHQIPAWYDEDGKLYVAETEEEAREQAGQGGNKRAALTRDSDVLDTWFSSALWPFSTLGWPEETPELAEHFPGDTLVTGFDIITFWVSRMMMFSLYLTGKAPFKDVYIHALVRDAKGQKMSKSKGNVMDPLDLIDKYGCDALRFTLCALATQGRDIRLAEDRLEGYRNFITKLWNASRYVEMNGCKADPDFDPSAVQYTLNQWIIGEVIKTKSNLEDALTAHRFNDAANILYQFTWGTYCDWYLEFSKPYLGEEVEQSAETRATAAWALEQILLLLNPIAPYVTERLYANLRDKEAGSLISHAWPDYSDIAQDQCALQKMDWFIRVISEIRSVRADMNVPASAKIPLLVKDACEHTKDGFAAFDEILKRMARLESITMTQDIPKGAIQAVVDQTTLILPIADIIDLDAEKERLTKQIVKIEGDIAKLDGQLNNENFVSRAPAEVIEEKREQRETAQSLRDKVSAALEQLEAA